MDFNLLLNKYKSYRVRIFFLLNIEELEFIMNNTQKVYGGGERAVHRVLVGKPEGKRPLGRSRRRREDNIKMELQEVGGDCGDWMELAQDRDRWRALVSSVRNLRVPKIRGISCLAAEPVSKYVSNTEKVPEALLRADISKPPYSDFFLTKIRRN
jgi:hypothetical protein